MARKRKQMGWQTRMQEWTGVPVHVGDHSPLKLKWYEGPKRVLPDDSGRKTLRYRNGFITDGKWALTFSGDPLRNANPQHYDLFWTDLHYGGESTRKSSLTISETDLCALELTRTEGAWKPRVYDARFEATEKDERMHIELEHDSTVVLLHRCLGRVMMTPTDRVKDSPDEPYRRLFEFLAAINYEGFQCASAVCAVNYEQAMRLLVPEPFFSQCFVALGKHDALDHPRRRKIPDLHLPASRAILQRLIETPERTRIIYLEEIGADVLRHNEHRSSKVGTSISTIRRHIVDIGLRTTSVPGVGTAITISEYLEHRDAFLNPRDRRKH